MASIVNKDMISNYETIVNINVWIVIQSYDYDWIGIFVIMNCVLGVGVL